MKLLGSIKNIKRKVLTAQAKRNFALHNYS